MSAKVLEASPESGTRNDPFSSSSASIYVPGTLKNARIGGTSCGLAVVVETATMATEHVGSLTAQTLPSHALVTGGGVGGAAGTGRKRHHSTSKSAGQIKRRRKTYERNGSKPKFLLGGSITDPLNLNSLDDEEISKIANAVTPACSPLPQINKDPDPIIVPQDFKDPLKLNTADDSTENNSPLTKTLVSRKSSGKKKKYHNSGEAKRDSIESVGNSDRDGDASCTRPLWLELQNSKTTKLANKIVSPVLPDSRGRKRKASRTEPSSRLAKALLIDDLLPQPQPKAKSSEPELKRLRKSPEVVNKFKRQQSHDAKTSKHLPKFREQDKKFQYGNYARYYGYRTPDSDDNRIDHFKCEWFEGKKCLDIGCNSGHVTLAIAKLFNPSSIVGVDIDGNLVGVARKNVKHCLEELFREKKGKGRVNFPVSLQKTYGPLAPPPTSTSSPAGRESSSFPANVLFRCANFVLKDDSLLETQKEEYDTILCLSVTKWIHLNWGDAGIKRFFKRIYRALHPGGRLILEPQAWQSYQKKRKMTETTYHNYNEIRFKPTEFKEYLLSQEVGFTSCEVIGTPVNKSKGFRRPMMMFTKLQTISRPVSRRPSTEKPPATATSSVTSSIPAIPPQPLMQPRVSSSIPMTAGVGAQVKLKVKEEPVVDIPAAEPKHVKPKVKEEPPVDIPAAEPKPEKPKVKEEPPVDIPAADPKHVSKLEVRSPETAGIGQVVRSKVIREPKEELLLEAETVEGGKAEAMDAKEVPEKAEEGGTAMTVTPDDTANDAVTVTTLKSEPEEVEEKGDTTASSLSSSCRKSELETKGEKEGLRNKMDSGGTT